MEISWAPSLGGEFLCVLFALYIPDLKLKELKLICQWAQIKKKNSPNKILLPLVTEQSKKQLSKTKTLLANTLST